MNFTQDQTLPSNQDRTLPSIQDQTLPSTQDQITLPSDTDSPIVDIELCLPLVQTMMQRY